jgi:hypothetical protein
MRQVQEEAVQVPAGDVEDYYRKNIAEFEVASFERIVIPVRTQLPQPVAAQGNAAEDVMTKEAELLRIRAAAGEDFSKLQTQAYAAAGVSGDNAPNPKMDKIRRRSLPPAHASVFDLKLNEVSPVLSDPTGHYIYKLDWKGTESLDAVKNEISNNLRGQRVRKMMKSLEQDPFDDAGCIAPPNEVVALITPTGDETQEVSPCFDHPTLTDILNTAKISWRYYSPLPGIIWNAPTGIEHICVPNAPPPNGTACTGADWTNNVIIPNTQVWVIPSGQASDHPGISDGSGPSWVASVVNAIGNSQYWSNTAIIIT